MIIIPGSDRRLKTVDPWFQLVWDGLKTVEVRKSDRDFQIGQEWYLDHYDPVTGYGHKQIYIKITHVLAHDDFPEGIQPGYCMISFQKLANILVVSR